MNTLNVRTNPSSIIKSLAKVARLLPVLVVAGLAAGLLLVAGTAQGTTLYWSGNGSTLGGAGTWDTTLTRWSASNAGPFSTAWVNGSNDVARFSSTAGTVANSVSITVGGLWFDTTGYVISNAPGNTLIFGAANNAITLNNIAAATIKGTVGGTGNVTLTALNPATAGAVTFSGASSGGWSGATTINAGMTLATTSASGAINQVLNNTSAITINGGAITFNRALNQQLNAISDSAPITVNGGGSFAAGSADAGGASANESFGAVTINSGQFNFNLVNNASSGWKMTMAGLTAGPTAAETFCYGGNGSWVVTGAAATPANQIIGPWATIGGQNSVAAQTDYAVFNGSSAIAAAAIAASSEGTWGTLTNAYTANAGLGAITLTGTHNINALRSISAANTVTVTASSPTIALASHTLNNNDAVVFNATTMPAGLTAGTVYYVVNAAAGTFQVSATQGGGAITPTTAGSAVQVTGAILLSSGNNLGSLGILNGVATTLTIAATGTGAVTLPSATSSNLHVNTGSGAITINAPITDNGAGALTLVKNDTGGNLTLAGANTYTGGTVINAGTVLISSDSNLGNTSGGITFGGSAALQCSANGQTVSSTRTNTVNNGAIATFQAAGSGGADTFSVAGKITGSGGIRGYKSYALGSYTLTLSSTASDFTGPIILDGSSVGPTVNLGGLQDGSGYGNIVFIGGCVLNYTGTSAVTLNNRQIQLTSTGNSSFVNNGSGAMTVNTDLSVPGTGGKVLTLGGSYTGNNTFAGLIANGSSSSLGVTVSGSGMWILPNTNNTYTGQTIFSSGTLSINSIKDYGVACSIGYGTAGTAIQGAYGATANLVYTGSGDSSNRQFVFPTYNVGGNSFTAIYNNGTGPLTFSTNTFNAYSTYHNSKTHALTLGGSYTGGANQIQGAITDASSGGSFDPLSLTKVDPCTWMLSGSNTFTGATTISGGGTLILDYTTQNNQKLANNKALTLSGGTVTLKGGSYTEVASATTLNTMGTFLKHDGGSSMITLSNITRAVGSTIDFADALIANTTTANINGILGGWATVGGGDWAVSGSPITAYTGYTTPFPAAGPGVSTTNYLHNVAGQVQAAVSANSLKIVNGQDSDTLTLNGNLTLTCASATSLGGILYAGGYNNNYTINGAARIQSSAANQELIFNVNTGALTVSAYVGLAGATGPVTKTGPGTLILSASNSYAAVTYVNQGTLRLANASGAGTTSQAINVQNGAAVELDAGVNIGAKPITTVGAGVSSGGALRNISGTNTYGGAITVGTGGTRINSGGGLLNLTNTIVNAGNTLTVGGAGNIAISSVISGTGGLAKDGAGTLILSGKNTYSGATTINNGTLVGVVGGSCSNSAVTVASAGALEIRVTTNAQWTCAGLGLNDGAHLNFNFLVDPSATVAPLSITGNVTFSGTPVIAATPGNLQPGTYPLMVVGGTAPTGTVPTLSGVNGKLFWEGNVLKLTVVATGTLIMVQ